MLYKIKDNEVLCQLTVKPKANVSCQLKFWPFISCQLTASIPSFDGKTLCWISNWIQRSIQENAGSKRKLQSIIIKVSSWRLYNVFNQQDQKSFSTVWSLIKRSLRQGRSWGGGGGGGGGGPGLPVIPLGRPSFEKTTYNIQVAKTP